MLAAPQPAATGHGGAPGGTDTDLLPTDNRSSAIHVKAESALQPTESPSDGRNTLRALAWTPSSDEASSAAASTIVLLHGLGDGANIWRPMMASWKTPLPVLALDLPGHGGSPWLSSAPYEIRTLARHVAEALGERRLHRPVLVGHSLGARIAVELVSGQAITPAATILVDMNAGDNEAVRQAVRAHLDVLLAGAPSLTALEQLLLARLPLADHWAVSTVVRASAVEAGGRWRIPLDPAVIGLVAPSRSQSEVWQRLADIRGPAALIRGAFSGVLDRRTADRIAQVLPWRPPIIETVDDAGHAIPLEQPAFLARSIEKCLRSWRIVT
ncbi:MAG: alpha/beta hydrolase [Proteobacteria bacterium]|nr:alpha/beta hydrolase [Pseudomonadota bacterium]